MYWWNECPYICGYDLCSIKMKENLNAFGMNVGCRCLRRPCLLDVLAVHAVLLWIGSNAISMHWHDTLPVLTLSFVLINIVHLNPPREQQYNHIIIYCLLAQTIRFLCNQIIGLPSGLVYNSINCSLWDYSFISFDIRAHTLPVEAIKSQPPPPFLTTCIRGTIDSILTSCLTLWYGNCTTRPYNDL